MFVSFCIITIGSKPDETNLCIESIRNNFRNNDDYEIIVVGNNLKFLEGKGCTLIEDNEFIEFLGKRKNIAFENSKGDIIVHCDDDIIFPDNWLSKFKQFDLSNQDWEIMGNKILLPDGGRYWDRSTFFPEHKMVDYDYQSESDTFYQTGCFSICKRELLSKITWSNEIPFYGSFKAFRYNEDIEFSLRLKENNIKIYFDKNNIVWHSDYSYLSDGITCNKKQYVDYVEYRCLSFILLLNNFLK